jgi:hypothetical protein
VGIAFTVYLTTRGAPVWWHVLAALPFLMASLGYFQSREQLCVFHAALDQRDMDGGAEKVTNPAELSAMRQQAARVWTRSLIAAAMLTGLALVLPVLRLIQR